MRTEKWERLGLDRFIYICAGDWIREAQVDEVSMGGWIGGIE